jgi:hypothetical protein
MPRNALFLLLEQRLVQLGCPVAQSRRSAWEIADHYEDLKAGALEEGLSEAQAEARAAERLGDPRALAERLAAALRRSSWWGRHPVIGFCLLPSVGIFLLLTLVPFVTLLAMKGSMPASRWQTLADGGTGYGVLAAALQISFYGSLVALMTLVCRLARRAAVGLKWTLTACVLCALHASFINFWVHPHSLYVGYLAEPNWICAAIPLLCAMAAAARQWRAARSLASAMLVAGLFLAPGVHAEEKPLLHRGWIGGEYKVERPWSIRQALFPPPEILYDRSFPSSVRRSQNAAIKITALGTNTPAALAGLRQGDLILQVNHLAVTRLNDFRRRIDQSKSGTAVALTIYRDGQTMELEAPVGRETFHSGGWFSVCLPSAVHGWRLIPDAGLSVVFAGWDAPRGLRQDLGSQKEVFDPSWSVWLGIFDFSTGKNVISETNVSHTPSRPKTAMAAR